MPNMMSAKVRTSGCILCNRPHHQLAVASSRTVTVAVSLYRSDVKANW